MTFKVNDKLQTHSEHFNKCSHADNASDIQFFVNTTALVRGYVQDHLNV